MIGSACVQVAFNLGNALGASIGQAVLTTGATYAWPSLAGVPFCLAAVALLVVFFVKFERLYGEEQAGEDPLQAPSSASQHSRTASRAVA